MERLLSGSTTSPDRRLDPLLRSPWQQVSWPHPRRFHPPRQGAALYASLELETALAEVAAARSRFWQALPANSRPAALRSLHTAFSLSYHCPSGAQLQNPPFRRLRDLLTGSDPQPTRQLAVVLRDHGISGWEYPSGCCPHFGLNLLLLDPEQIGASRPGEQQLWLCEVSKQGVWMAHQGRLLQFDHWSNPSSADPPALSSF
nr:RES family NAD+ phosphorylase [Motiliproteus sediminis]